MHDPRPNRRISLPATVRATVARTHLFAGLRGVLAAVSGGADSVALLRVLASLCRDRNLKLHALHVHHGLRGAAADADAAFVTELCAALGVPLVLETVDVGAEVRLRGGSVEMAARELRRRRFREVCARTDCDAVATGHQADDVAETVLMRLARGAGPDGLGAIRVRGRVDGVWRIRPLIECRARTIRAWLREQGFAWREDASNADLAIERNRVRRIVLPWLEDHWKPGLSARLAWLARRLDEDEQLLGRLALEALDRCRMPGDAGALSAAALRDEPPALQGRLLRFWLREQGFHAPAAAWVEGIRHLVRSSHGSRRRVLEGGRTVWRVYDSLHLAPDRAVPTALPCIVPRIPGWTRAERGSLRVFARLGTVPHAVEPVSHRSPAECTFWLNAGLWAGRPLVLRGPRPGDRIRREDGRGRRSLQDLLVDARIPALERGRVPVLVCGGRVIGVGGLGRARGWAPRRGGLALEVRILSSHPFPAPAAPTRTTDVLSVQFRCGYPALAACTGTGASATI